MSRQLLIMRHGKAEPDSADGDFGRRLDDKGKRDAQRVGVWLAQRGLIPDALISSPAARALNTAEKCLKAAGPGVAMIRTDARLYPGSLGALLEAIAQVPSQVRRLLLVGHNPSLEQLLAFLAGPPRHRADDHSRMSKAAMAVLDMPEDWSHLSERCARLYEHLDAQTLPERFPFPGHRGRERRERPAYYYRQSSAIPWRKGENGLEILIIGSSQRKHWVVPKGVGEPGLSLRDSAAKEAWEEAGIHGRIDDKPLGSYNMMKWGALVQVEVYAMAVDGLADAPEWQESHRGRRWVSPHEAETLLREKLLAPLIRRMCERLA